MQQPYPPRPGMFMGHGVPQMFPQQQQQGYVNNPAIENRSVFEIFRGVQSILIEQKKEWLELLTDWEVKNRYQIFANDKHGPPLAFVTEESNTCERVCCKSKRSLIFKMSPGNINAPGAGQTVIMEMHKKFDCGAGSCFYRPEMVTYVPDRNHFAIGVVKDPFACSHMNQKIHIGGSAEPLFIAEGSICQIGICVPCAGEVVFEITRQNVVVARITRPQLDCGQMMFQTNDISVHFLGNLSDVEKCMIISSAFLIDMQYFEPENQQGGTHG